MRPPEIFTTLKPQVIGQSKALREVSVALYKHLIGHTTGNILMIGGSGTGKTTIMRAVEGMLDRGSEFGEYGTVVRMNANLLSDLASRGLQSTVVLEKIVTEARARFGEDAPLEQLKKCVEHGIVFVDEVDKIRSHVGDEANVAGIIAQESLLTLMESEIQMVPIEVKEANGQWVKHQVPIDTGGILFIAGGAFEELYDQVFDRVTAGGKNPPWRLVTKADGSIERRIVFSLADNLLHADLFDYGITPQFLARFDSIVTLRALGAKDLITIFKDIPGAMLPTTQHYFKEYGVNLSVTEDALYFIADKATENPRLGARALKEVFGRVIREFEFDPYASGLITKAADGSNELLITVETLRSAYGEDDD
ncbi:MAG: ATP-dependent Clp protease ATP-binding subunit ClpX [Myxococcota bacterium]|jgi:ATP-dependent Clp protease ATP-binding subunit ClpX